MRRSIVGLAVLALLATGGYAVFAGGKLGRSCTSSEHADGGAACTSDQSAASSEAPRGKVAGNFDLAMAGCRFSCATKLEYESADVVAQPGAKVDELTQCPVSGVVFAVDANSPRVHVASDDYVTCCDQCAAKLKRDPRHYLRV